MDDETSRGLTPAADKWPSDRGATAIEILIVVLVIVVILVVIGAL